MRMAKGMWNVDGEGKISDMYRNRNDTNRTLNIGMNLASIRKKFKPFGQ